MKRSPGWVLVAAEAALAVGLASSPWLRAYHQSAAMGVLAAAAALPVAITMAVAVTWRRPAAVSYGCSAIGLVALLLVAVAHSPAALGSGLAHGSTRLFTDTLPLSDPTSLLAPAVVVTWLTGAVTAELLARGRWTGAALGTLVTSYVGTFAATSAAPGRQALTGGLLLVALGALAITRLALVDPARSAVGQPSAADPTGLADTAMLADPATPADRGPGASALDRAKRGDQSGVRGTRRLAAGGALVVVVAVGASLAVPAIPTLEARGAAINRRSSTNFGRIITPVAAIAALRDDQPDAPPTALFTVTTSDPTSGYLTLASLDTYDGDSWSFDRTFQPTGGRIPGGTLDSLDRPVQQRYTLVHPLGPSLPFIPYLDRPVEILGITADSDTASGMVMAAGSLHLPTSYQVISRAPLQPLERTADAILADTGGLAGGLAIPADAKTDVAGAVQWLATITAGRPAPTIDFLRSAAVAMRNAALRVVPSGTKAAAIGAVGGTSLAEVIPAVSIAHQATPEQFATLFVMAARYLGVPAILATGFRITPPAGGTVAAGTYQVTNRQAWTWAEIPIAGHGWVVVDPTPDRSTAGYTPPDTGTRTALTTLPPSGSNAVPNNTPGGHALAPAGFQPVSRHSHRTLLLPLVYRLGALVIALLVFVPALAAARRSVRRRLRRRGDPPAAAVGAWLELLDGLSEVGVRISPAATSVEVAVTVGERFGADVIEPVRHVGALADQALCSTQWRPGPAVAEQAWLTERSVRRRVRSTLPLRQRLRVTMAVGASSRRPTIGADRRGIGRRALASDRGPR